MSCRSASQNQCKMACFNALPAEILQKIIRNIQKPYKTKLLLLNKALCGLFMIEQLRILAFYHFQLKNFIEIIRNNDIGGPHLVPKYRNLLDHIYQLYTDVCDEAFLIEEAAPFIHRCKNLRYLHIVLETDIDSQQYPANDISSDISSFFVGLPLSIVEIRFGSTWFNEKAIQSLVKYVRQSKKLRKLRLNYNKFCGEDTRILVECLRQNTVLTDLDLSYNLIGSKGICALAESLNQNVTLTNLYVSRNGIDAKGAYAIAKCLKQNAALTNLDLSYNNICKEGAHALAEALKQNTSLINLNLQANNIFKEGAHALAEGLKQNIALTNLNLRMNGFNANDDSILIDSLRQNTNLTVKY